MKFAMMVVYGIKELSKNIVFYDKILLNNKPVINAVELLVLLLYSKF